MTGFQPSTSRYSLHMATLVVALALHLESAPASATCQITLYDPVINGVDWIVMQPDTPAGYLQVPAGLMHAAAAIWNDNCGGIAFPTILDQWPYGALNPMIVAVSYKEFADDNDACGVHTIPYLPSFMYHTIVIYQKLANGTACPQFDKVLAHELGHVLRLSDWTGILVARIE